MKWFKLKNKNNIKKRGDHSTYLKVENGRVVPVTDDEKEEKTSIQEPFHFENQESDETVVETKTARWMKWVWLLIIIGLGYGTVQLFGGLAFENRESFKLQEIKQNTVQVVKEDEKTSEKDEKLDVSDSIADKTSDWRDNMINSFTGDNTSIKEKEPTEIEVPLKSVNHEDSSLLLSIRALDEEGTVLLEQIRDASVRHIEGDISRGQYLLRLQAVDLKLKRYSREIHSIDEQASSTPSYNTLLDYVWVKKESLQSLGTELRVSNTSHVAPVFNGYVDVHNELTIEADQEFVRQLKRIGYEAEIRNGVIEYR